MAKIGLKGMKFYAFHGYYDFERRIGNEFIVDVMVVMDIETSPEEKIANTYNYEEIHLITKKFMSRRYQLLETLAHDIGEEVKFSNSNIQSVTVSVQKLNPPVGGKVAAAFVEITV